MVYIVRPPCPRWYIIAFLEPSRRALQHIVADCWHPPARWPPRLPAGAGNERHSPRVRSRSCDEPDEGNVIGGACARSRPLIRCAHSPRTRHRVLKTIFEPATVCCMALGTSSCCVGSLALGARTVPHAHPSLTTAEPLPRAPAGCTCKALKIIRASTLQVTRALRLTRRAHGTLWPATIATLLSGCGSQPCFIKLHFQSE